MEQLDNNRNHMMCLGGLTNRHASGFTSQDYNRDSRFIAEERMAIVTMRSLLSTEKNVLQL